MQKKIPTREAYGNTLAEIGSDERIVVMDEISRSLLRQLFSRKYPERFFNMGIAEANMMSAAAGLHPVGK